MNIRNAHEEDAQAIAEIYAPHCERGTASFELEALDAAEIHRRMDAVQNAGLPYLVAEVDGKVAGFAYALQFRARAAYRYTVEDNVFVNENYQGKGLGRALLNELMERCSAKGVQEMLLVLANPQENGAAVALHEAAGFREVGTLRGVGHKRGELLDIKMMQRHVGDAGVDAWPRG